MKEKVKWMDVEGVGFVPMWRVDLHWSSLLTTNFAYIECIERIRLEEEAAAEAERIRCPS